MVKAWREIVTIPTYEVGKPEKNPIFLEKRVYQGSSGVVYPYPVIESISDEKTDREWKAVFLENEYIKVMVLPELGGRIQMAYDKIRERHFVYYNHVIKPALVGLAGPWISGGIEFNWPQHHRPSTYMPVDADIVDNGDGSVTVWVNEMERMFHQKGMAGFTLRPGCAYLEIQGRVSNRTSLPQTFLWWANPAVEVNDAYQSVFPPDVNAVFDHGKRAVSSFPIATGTYYKMDYSAGVDISNYKNIFVPTSYMAVNSKYDFEGGYENDTRAGMLHVASHHFSPGKKQWTWGNGDFGRAWDRNLTDCVESFRPYIELMAGVYTENQPDFTWLMPYEEKQFVQYFMPYREIGIVKQASKDFVMNIELSRLGDQSFSRLGDSSFSRLGDSSFSRLGTNVTSPNDQTTKQPNDQTTKQPNDQTTKQPNDQTAKRPNGQATKQPNDQITFKVLATSKKEVRVVLQSKAGDIYYDKVVTLSPEAVLEETVGVQGATLNDLVFTISESGQKRRPLLVWQAEDDELRPIPDAAEAALPPHDTKTVDQLYLTGLHLEQYRHATWSALDYYEEALRRDPDDVRCLNQTGLWYLRRGRFAKAELYLRKAVKIWQKRNPNPYDGEAIFNLALCLKYKSGRLGDSSFSRLGDLSFSRLGTNVTSPNDQTTKRPNDQTTKQPNDQTTKQPNDQTTKRPNDQTTKRPNDQQEAYELFWKSTWNKAWADAGYFEAACISMGEGRYDDALDELERSLSFNSNNHKARALKAAVLRKLGRKDEALQWCLSSYTRDHFNYGCMYEEHLLTGSEAQLDHIRELMHGSAHNYHELALDYAQAGLWQECIDVLGMDDAQNHPMTYYYMGYAMSMLGEQEKANACFMKAEQTDPYCCFPNRLEDILALECAKTLNPDGAKAPYYLGCLYYDKRQYDLAIDNWEQSSRLDANFPTVWRNLALARFNKQNKKEEAVAYMEQAFRLDETDARILMELDQLYKRLQKPHSERLAILQQYPQLTAQRDDLVLEEITLLNQLGRYEEAMAKLDAHIFHPWEGGEGKVPTQYQFCRVELALQAIKSQDYNRAIALLNECLVYPHHLGEGKLYGAQDNDFYYLLGIAYDKLATEAEANASLYTLHSSLKEKARECWEEATKGPQEPAAAMYYNDAKPDKIFYQGMALYKLGRDDEAHGRFYKLINYGKQHLFAGQQADSLCPGRKQLMDYFAVSLPDLLIWEECCTDGLSELDKKNLVHCKYMLALGFYGMGENDRAERYLGEAESLDSNHLGILQFRNFTRMMQ